MGGLTRPNVIKIISEFLADEVNIEGVIAMCIEKMKDNIESIDLVTLSSEDKLKISELNNERTDISAKILTLEQQNKQLSLALNDLQHQVRVATTYSDLLARRIDDGDQYARRLNLLVDGIPTKRAEKPDSIRATIMNEIQRLGCDIANCELDRAHRAEHPYYRDGVRHQAVIVHFISWSARDKLYQARKKSTFHFRPDMTDRRRDILQYARSDIAARSDSGAQKLVDFAGMDKNCRLFLRSTDGRMLHFSSEFEFDAQYRQLEDNAQASAPYSDDFRGRFDDEMNSSVVEIPAEENPPASPPSIPANPTA